MNIRGSDSKGNLAPLGSDSSSVAGISLNGASPAVASAIERAMSVYQTWHEGVSLGSEDGESSTTAPASGGKTPFSRRVSMATATAEIKEHKSASLASRKALNEATKLFRARCKEHTEAVANLVAGSNTAAGAAAGAGEDATAGGAVGVVRTLVGESTELLKQYQEEVDRLGKRAKHAEAAFADIYRALSGAPDPAPVISNLCRVLATTATENALELDRLRGEVEAYETEFTGLKNQDIRCARLEERVEELTEEMEEKVAQGVEVAVRARVAEAEEKVAAAEEAVEAAEKRCAAAMRGAGVAEAHCTKLNEQLFTLTSAHEARCEALQMENVQLSEQYGRAVGRCSELESQLIAAMHSSRQASAAAASASATATSAAAESPTPEQQADGGDSDLTAAGSTHAATVQFLKERLELLQEELREVAENGRAALEREQAESQQLREELKCRPTVEQLGLCREQLKVLQHVVFGEAEVEGEEAAAEAGAGEGKGKETASTAPTPPHLVLQLQLAERVRRLEGELVHLRCASTSAAQRELETSGAVSKLQVRLREREEMLRRLEVQLDRSSRAAGGGAEQGQERGKDGGLRDLEELLSGEGGEEEGGGTAVSKGTGPSKSATHTSARSGSGGASTVSPTSASGSAAAAGSTSSMVSILQAQRDHFRDRLQEAQVEVQRLQGRLQACGDHAADGSSAGATMAEVAALQAKIRELEGYGGPGGLMRTGGGGDIESGGRGGGRRDFAAAEKQRKLMELSPTERILISAAVSCLNNYTARRVALLYFLSMHFLVFSTIYHTVHYHRPSI